MSFHSINTPVLEQWQQLIEAMKASSNTRQWVTLINPPFIPNENYLAQIGLENHYLRVLRLDPQRPDSEHYIQRCLQNGKSSLVAIWTEDEAALPQVLHDEARVGCKAVVFSACKLAEVKVKAAPQLELVF